MRGLGSVVLLCLTAVLAAQPALTFPPPPVNPPDKETLAAIEQRAARLAQGVEHLQRLGVRDPAMADVEVFLRADRMIVKHGEFYKDSAKHVLPVLDQGLLRATQQSRGETPWYNAPGQTVPRGYRSRLDGTVQPYAVTYPHDYGLDKRKRYRVDVVLHGRDAGLTEVSFLYRHRGAKPATKDQSFVQIDIFGRGNNAYRWAGESDVFEAVDHFFAVETFLGREAFLDRSKVVLRGYSMGGAGTWHIGLHRPDQWVVIGPGAGFTTTRGYVKLPEKLPAYQEACLHIYDAVDYAENAFDVPIVAYNGDDDPQIQSARNIEARLKPLGLSMTHYVAPDLKHQQPPPEYQAKLLADYAKYAEKGKPEYPPKVRFVTWTLKYPGCYWVELLGLDEHYKRARVEADRVDDGFTLKTENVRTLRLAMWPGATREPIAVTIDGQKLAGVRPQLSRANELFVYLEKKGDRWASALAERLFVDRLRSPRKSHGLQGPIDDAFTAPFLCVRGTGTPWEEETGRYAAANLERFKAEWSKYMRGDLPVKDDTEVTADDIATRHLILFGDPGSNGLIEQALPGLPLVWTRKRLALAGADTDSSGLVPVMIYPSPLAADRYIVLNSGHTFHANEFQGTNALLYPRLGDYAVLKPSATKDDPLAAEVRGAGLFDDGWRARPGK